LKREYFADLKRARDSGISPLLVAALQGQITAWYDIAGLEQIEVLNTSPQTPQTSCLQYTDRRARGSILRKHEIEGQAAPLLPRRRVLSLAAAHSGFHILHSKPFRVPLFRGIPPGKPTGQKALPQAHYMHFTCFAADFAPGICTCGKIK
jgi:hypothetical protein